MHRGSQKIHNLLLIFVNLPISSIEPIGLMNTQTLTQSSTPTSQLWKPLAEEQQETISGGCQKRVTYDSKYKYVRKCGTLVKVVRLSDGKVIKG